MVYLLEPSSMAPKKSEKSIY